MDSQLSSSKRSFLSKRIWIGVVFFLLAAAPGLWNSSLVNILSAYGALWVLDYTMAVIPAMAICSSLMFASLADRRYHAQNLLGVLSLSGAVFLWLSFSSLEWGWSPWWFMFFQACNAFIAAPLWVLLTKVALVHCRNPERDFPLFKIWGTVGWLLAGVLVSWLALDASATTGKMAGYLRVVIGVAAFMMPETPPVISARKYSLREKLGLGALVLLENRKLKVYFVTTLIFTIPLASFYLYAPKLLMELAAVDRSGFALGVQAWLPGPTAQMTLGQMTEIGALLLMSYLGVRARVRMLVALAMVLGMCRFALFALAGEHELLALMWLGVSLHGLVFTFFSVTGQMFVDRRVPNEMRAQAQALMSLMTSVGAVIGPLVVGQLYRHTAGEDSGQDGWYAWPLFWWVLTGVVFLCLVYFVNGYRDRGSD